MNFLVATIINLAFIAWQVHDCSAAFLGDRLVAEAHNEIRRLEASSNMKVLAWDPILAQQAADYADQCNFAHAPNLDEGENLFATTAGYDYSKFQSAVNSWYAEINDYDLDTNTCNSGKVCGHYTAVVWANTERVGCAAQHCPSGIKDIEDWESGTIVVCRYAPSGNWQGQTPYEKGTACSACDDGWAECDNGLCSKEAAVTAPPVTEPTNPPKEETNEPPVLKTTTGSETTKVTTPEEEEQITSPMKPTTTPATAHPTDTATTTTEKPSTIDTATTTTEKPSTIDTATTTTEKPNTTPPTGFPTSPSYTSSCSEEWRSAMSDWKHQFEMWKAELAQWQDETGKP